MCWRPCLAKWNFHEKIRCDFRSHDAARQPGCRRFPQQRQRRQGVWVTDGERIKGKWVEVIADRATHKFTGRAEISYDVKVNVDAFSGTVTASSYDANGTLTDGPTSPTPLEGRRVTLP